MAMVPRALLTLLTMTALAMAPRTMRTCSSAMLTRARCSLRTSLGLGLGVGLGLGLGVGVGVGVEVEVEVEVGVAVVGRRAVALFP